MKTKEKESKPAKETDNKKRRTSYPTGRTNK